MLDDLLGVEIITQCPSKEELEHLIKQEEGARLALDAFLSRRISLEDYCDILELCGVNMDEYIINLQSNIQATGIII